MHRGQYGQNGENTINCPLLQRGQHIAERDRTGVAPNALSGSICIGEAMTRSFMPFNGD